MKQLNTNNKTLNKTFSTLEDRFIKAHGNYYNYDKVIFNGMMNKVTITCPIHGDFEQLPIGHVNGKGCYQCGKDRAAKKHCKFTKDEIIEISKQFKSTMDFRSKEPEAYRIANKRFGKDFLQDLCKDMYNPSKQKTTEEFKTQLSDEFTLLSEYVNSHVDVLVKHNNCGTEFSYKPYHLLNGSCGCPTCKQSGGYSIDKPGTLYLIQLKTRSNEYVWKIGITNLSVKERYRKWEQDKFIQTFEYYFENGKLCYDSEQYFINKYKDYRYNGPPLLKSGNTEILTHNIKKELDEYYKNISCSLQKD